MGSQDNDKCAPGPQGTNEDDDDGRDLAPLETLAVGVIAEGDAELYKPEDGGPETVIATVSAGALIGELALINKLKRALSLRTKTDMRALRIGSEEFLTVVENDTATAVKLLQVVARYAVQPK